MTAQKQGICIALFCVTIWASTAAIVRFSANTLDHYQFLFWSSLFSLIAVTLVSAIKGTLKIPFSYKAKDWVSATFIGFIGTFLYYLLLFKGLAQEKGINVIIIQYTWPLMLSFLSIFLFKEVLDWRKVLATFLGLSAVVVVISKGHVTNFTVQDPELLIWVAIGALCFASFNLGMKHLKLEPTSMFVVFFTVATISSFIAMMMNSSFIMPQGKDWLAVIFLGAFVNGLADLIWLWALRKTEASYLAPFIYFAPVIAVMYLVIFFHDPFYPSYGMGLMLIVISGLLSTKAKFKFYRRKKTQTA